MAYNNVDCVSIVDYLDDNMKLGINPLLQFMLKFPCYQVDNGLILAVKDIKFIFDDVLGFKATVNRELMTKCISKSPKKIVENYEKQRFHKRFFGETSSQCFNSVSSKIDELRIKRSEPLFNGDLFCFIFNDAFYNIIYGHSFHCIYIKDLTKTILLYISVVEEFDGSNIKSLAIKKGCCAAHIYRILGRYNNLLLKNHPKGSPSYNFMVSAKNKLFSHPL